MPGKKRKGLKIILALFILAALFCVWFLQSEFCQKKIMYPFLYEKEINKYSKLHNLSPFLVASVIKNESRFKASAKSERGATGLMQLMPETALWIADQTKWQGFNTKLLEEPDINIRFGCWYLNELRHEFKDEKIYLAAYNAGRGNIQDWLETGKWDGKTIDNIPFEETRKYVKKVLQDKSDYERLYKNQVEKSKRTLF